MYWNPAPELVSSPVALLEKMIGGTWRTESGWPQALNCHWPGESDAFRFPVVIYPCIAKWSYLTRKSRVPCLSLTLIVFFPLRSAPLQSIQIIAGPFFDETPFFRHSPTFADSLQARISPLLSELSLVVS